MRGKLVTLGGMVVCLLCVAMIGQTLSQQGEGGGRNRQGRRNFDPQLVRQRMVERIMASLRATEAEAPAIKTKLEKVVALQSDLTSRGGRFGLGGRFGRRGGQGDGRGDGQQARPPSNAPPSELANARRQLQQALRPDSAADNDEIIKSLTVYRSARDKQQKELDQARKDLAKLLNKRQEAQLVVMGYVQ